MMQDEVESGEEQGPSSLPPIKLLGCHEVLQIFVVGPNLTLVFTSLHKVPPLFQHPNDGEHLLVVNLLIPLDR
jgi:hypothetical protein